MALADGKSTRDPLLSSILLAKMINQFLGVELWPAEVDELPEDFIEAVRGLVMGLPKIRAHQEKVEGYLERWRKSHPTYGKHR